MHRAPGRIRARQATGSTLVELLAVVAIVGISVVAAALYLKPFEAPVESGATQVAALLRLARSRAMATTSAYRVYPSTADQIRADFAPSCGAATWTNDAELGIDLPRDVTTTSTAWAVCFNSRGVSTNNVTVSIAHADYGTEQIEVLLGGAVRVQP